MKTLMKPKVVLFDIDGTLLNTGGAGQSALECALKSMLTVQTPFSGVLTAGRTDRGIVDEIFATCGVDNTTESRQQFRDSYLMKLPETLAQKPGSVLPGVRNLLNRLEHMEEIVLGLLTGNYEEGAWIKLRHFQLDHYFQFGGFGDHHADRGDVARSAVLAAEQRDPQNGRQTQVSVIGDTPADVLCARTIGARAIAVATGSYCADQLLLHAPDHLFSDLEDTAAVIDRILAS